MAEFGHYARGPRLNAMCCKFKTPYEHQIKALKKDASGWHSMDTSAYCLQNPKVDITKYIDGCIPYVLDEVCNDKSPVEGFFRILRVHQEVRISLWSFVWVLRGTNIHVPRTRLLKTA